MAKIFSINGYWKDDNELFEDLLVTDIDSVPEGYTDEDIFYFGMSEEELKRAIGDTDTIDDFVITSFEEVKR